MMQRLKIFCGVDKGKKGEAGFTFIEVLGAIVILEILSVSILGMAAFGSRSQGVVEENLMVTNLMQAKAEEIRCRTFTTDVTETDQAFTSFEKYRFDVTQTVPYLSNAYLKRIDVVCRWTSIMGINRQESMVFLVADAP